MDLKAAFTNSASFTVWASEVPLEFFANRDLTKTYFGKFGKVKQIKFRPKHLLLKIEYTTEESMLNALELAGEYNGKIFKVGREEVVRKKKSSNNVDPDFVDDPDIKAELEAMGAFGTRKNYDIRSQAMERVSSPLPERNNRKSSIANLTKKKVSTTKETSLSFHPEQADLLNLIKQQAITAEEKYRLLDARDKLIRLRTKKDLLKASKATVGTCPDMCPEKERLMRITQHQVALYEQEEGGRAMNHHLAVKQYSRSSADQETPLPTELRPVSVLQMTMGYLMHQIMQMCSSPDVNMAEWYHFLWDRTRGIRKEITQQELCCQGSVALVEQCARFHIFCSARLVAEDPSVFDQKINTENLTKCLQTLKYMYHDLQLKGESCENEPEFRAYIILLNLNDGNFMWEVQQLKREIQDSGAVKFALAVHSSLDKNNYVQFFKLVRSTTFLNACILMRYFTQVRFSAMKIFLKCYTPRVSSLPISFLTKILAFESMDATIEFVETYGLHTDEHKSILILDRQSFAIPEYPYVLERAITVVESKQHSSIGEVVCGAALPPKTYENHIPQNSFDERGFLISWTDLEEPIKSTPKKIREPEPIKIDTSQPEPIPKLVKPPPKAIIPEALFKKPTESIFRKTISTNIFGNSIPSSNIFGNDIVPLTKTELPKVDNKRIKEEEERVKLEKEELKRKEEESRRLKEARLEIEREKRILEEKMRKIQEEKLEEARRVKELELKRVREVELKNEIKKGVDSVINYLMVEVEEKVRKEGLKRIRDKINKRKIRRTIWKWKELTRKHRKRKAVDFTPAFVGARTLQEEAEEFQTSNQNYNLSLMKRYKLGKPLDIIIHEKKKPEKINLTKLVHQSLTKKSLELDKKVRNELFWKITISLPNENSLSHTENILDQFIQWENKEGGTFLMDQSQGNPTITYCLEKQKGSLMRSKGDSNGFIFIANSLDNEMSSRIINNLRHYGLFVKIPVVFILQNYENSKANLSVLVRENIISDYVILIDRFTNENVVSLVKEGISFLAKAVEKTPPLEMDTLRSFLMKYLCTDVWKRANSFAKWNSNYKECLKNPRIVIYLYNQALDQLKNIVLNRAYKEFAKFPEIFKHFLRNDIPDSLPCDYKYFPTFWTNPSYIHYIEDILDSFKLPNFVHDWPMNNERELESAIFKYCDRIFTKPHKVFLKIMSILLRNVNPNVNFKDMGKVLWTDVIEVIAFEKLEETDFSLYGTGYVNQSVYNQLMVVYNLDSLEEYEKSDWFYLNNPLIRTKIDELLRNKCEELPQKEDDEDYFEEFNIDEAYNKIIQRPSKNMGILKREMTECNALMSDLEESILIHNTILTKSKHFLTTIVEDK